MSIAAWATPRIASRSDTSPIMVVLPDPIEPVMTSAFMCADFATLRKVGEFIELTNSPTFARGGATHRTTSHEVREYDFTT